MLISCRKLLNNNVITESGKQIGHVVEFNIDIDSQSILNYIVKPDNFLADLFQDDLIINRGQVIEISDQKIIVENNFEKKSIFKKLNKFKKDKKQIVWTNKNIRSDA